MQTAEDQGNAPNLKAGLKNWPSAATFPPKINATYVRLAGLLARSTFNAFPF